MRATQYRDEIGINQSFLRLSVQAIGVRLSGNALPGANIHAPSGSTLEIKGRNRGPFLLCYRKLAKRHRNKNPRVLTLNQYRDFTFCFVDKFAELIRIEIGRAHV